MQTLCSYACDVLECEYSKGVVILMLIKLLGHLPHHGPSEESTQDQ